jgi:hypothetical protein
MTTIISSVEDLCNVFIDVYSDDVYESKECAIEASGVAEFESTRSPG